MKKKRTLESGVGHEAILRRVGVYNPLMSRVSVGVPHPIVGNTTGMIATFSVHYHVHTLTENSKYDGGGMHLHEAVLPKAGFELMSTPNAYNEDLTRVTTHC